MNKARERAGAAVAGKNKSKSRPTANKVRSRPNDLRSEEQAPAREVVVRGTTISLPGLRFLDE